MVDEVTTESTDKKHNDGLVEDQSEASGERSRPVNQEYLGDDRQQCCLVKNIPDGTDSGHDRSVLK